MFFNHVKINKGDSWLYLFCFWLINIKQKEVIVIYSIYYQTNDLELIERYFQPDPDKYKQTLDEHSESSEELYSADNVWLIIFIFGFLRIFYPTFYDIIEWEVPNGYRQTLEKVDNEKILVWMWWTCDTFW